VGCLHVQIRQPGHSGRRRGPTRLLAVLFADTSSPHSRQRIGEVGQGGRRDGGGEADEEHPDTPVVTARAYTQELRCGLRLRGGGQGMRRDTSLTPEVRERGDAAYE
jgi:hypothetical protein